MATTAGDVGPRVVTVRRERSPLERLQMGRLAVATLVLVSVAGTAALRGAPFPVAPFAWVIAVTYGFSFASLLAVPRFQGSSRFAVGQICVDLVLETLLVYVTGGAFSVFTFVYLLSVMTASRVLGPWRSLPTAAGVVLVHGTLLTLLLYGVIPPVGQGPLHRDIPLEASVSLLVILGNMCASFVVAYVSAKLADRLRQVGQLALQVQADLTDFRVLHEDIVESVASGLVTLDRNGKLMTANRMAGVIAEAPPSALVGRSWEDLFAQAQPFGQVLADFERGGTRVRRLEGSLVRPSGTTVPLGVSLALLSRGEAPVGVVCSFQDLTQIKKMEEQVRRADRLAAVGELAASLAHEIRNPLLAVAGSIEELRRSLALSGADRHLMDIALREGDRLNSLLTEFLEYSRVRPVKRELCDVGALLGELVQLLSYDQRTSSGVKIVTEVTPPTLKAALDPKAMHQAIWNLCVNAVEAMPKGGELALSVRTQAEGRRLRDGDLFPRYLEVRVRDTGPGIPAEQQLHIFELFYSTKPQGFGLGLATVHRIVQDHGGQIDVESEQGRGTTFVLTIPLREAEWADG